MRKQGLQLKFKLLLLAIIFLNVLGANAQTVFYSASTGDLASITTWGTNLDGSGTNPTSLTGTGQTFHVANNNPGALDSALTLGSNSVFVFDSSTTLSGSALTGLINVPAAVTLTVSSDPSNLALNTIDPTSTIVYTAAGTPFIPGGNYGNLTINSTGTLYLGNVTSVLGTLALTAGTLAVGNPQAVGLSLFIYDSLTRSAGVIDASLGKMVFNNNLTVPAGTFAANNIKNLTLASGTLTWNQAITNITGTLTLTAGVFNLGSNQLTLHTAPVRTSGVINASLGTMIIATSIVIPSGTFSGNNINNLTINLGTNWNLPTTNITGTLNLVAGTFTLGTNDTLALHNAFTRTSGSLSATNGTIILSNCTLPNGLISNTIKNVIIASGTATLGTNNNLTVKDTLWLATGTSLVIGSNTLTLSTAPVVAGTGSINATSGNVSFGGSSSYTLPSGLFSINKVKNLTINTANAVTMGSNLTITGSLSIINGSGMLAVGSNTLSLANLSNTSTGRISVLPTSTITTTGALTSSLSFQVGDTLGTLNIGGNATLGSSLTVTGSVNITGTGDLAVGNHTLSLAGLSNTSTGRISVLPTSTITTTGALTSSLSLKGNDTLGTLNIGGNATLGNSLNISPSGTVTVTAGTFTTSGELNLLSSTAGTARIAAGSGTIAGTVNIQCYVPGQRGYRLLGHPYSTDQDVATLGTYFDITGLTAGNIGGCAGTVPSIYSYTPGASPAYAGITATGTGTYPAAATGGTHANGILAFIRGQSGEGCAGGFYSPLPVTFLTAAAVNAGGVSETVPAGGWNLISNPLPSQILLDSVTGINGLDAIKLVDPSGQAGGVTSTNGTQYINGSISTVIPINGAFLAHNPTGTDVTLIFPESCKSASTPTANLFKKTSVYPELELSVYKGSNLWDNWDLVLKPGTSRLAGDNGDLEKISNAQFDIYSLSKDNQEMNVDARDADSIADGETITLGLRSVPQNTYTLTVSAYSLPPDKTVYLHDKYTNTYTLVSNGMSYPFTVDGNAASQGQGRLELVFNNISNNTGIGNIGNQTPSVVIVPNPATNNINVNYSNSYMGNKSISIVNVVGQVIRIISSTDQNITIPVSDLANGVYLLKTIVTGKTITQRFIKN